MAQVGYAQVVRRNENGTEQLRADVSCGGVSQVSHARRLAGGKSADPPLVCDASLW